MLQQICSQPESAPVTIDINDGMRLHHVKTDKFKTLTCAMIFRNKLSRDYTTVNALLPLILKRGTMNYQNIQAIQARQEELYGAIFDVNIIKKGEEQLLQFYMECLDSDGNMEQALEFLKEASYNCLKENNGFNPKYVENSKLNLKNNIESRINDKKEYAKLRCLEEMCKNEPFGVYGDGYIEDISTLEESGIYSHYINMLKTSPLEWIVISNTSTEKLTAQIKSLFDEKRNCTTIDNSNNPIEKTAEKNIVEDSKVSQGKLCIGIRTNTENKGDKFYHLQLANELFGGSPESKLFLDVRESKGLCYYVNSFVYRFKTIMLVESGIDKKNFEKTSKIIKEEFDKIKVGEFSDDDLSKAKLSLSKKIRGITDYQARIMDFNLTQQIINDNDSISDILSRIENSTRLDCVKSVSDAYIDTTYFLSPK